MAEENKTPMQMPTPNPALRDLKAHWQMELKVVILMLKRILYLVPLQKISAKDIIK